MLQKLSYSAHQCRSRCFLHLDVSEEFLAGIALAEHGERRLVDVVVKDSFTTEAS